MKIYVIVDGYDYEGENVITAFDTKEKAKQHLEEWKKQYMKDFDTKEYNGLPFGFKFGTHYRIAEEIELNSEDGK